MGDVISLLLLIGLVIWRGAWTAYSENTVTVYAYEVGTKDNDGKVVERAGSGVHRKKNDPAPINGRGF